MSNLNPSRPEEMNEIMFEVFGVSKNKKKKVLLPHQQAAKEISAMIRNNQ
jgi:hypothetical protein